MYRFRTRPGKGRAILKFFIGLLVAFIVISGAYLFVEEYDRHPAPQAASTPQPDLPTPAPQADPSDAPASAPASVPDSPDPSADPSETEPAIADPSETEPSENQPIGDPPADGEPSASQSVEPDPTPIPKPERSLRMEGMSVPAQSENATFGLIDFKAVDNRLEVSAYLSQANIDAAGAEYYLVVSLMSGDASIVYSAWLTEESTGLDIAPGCFAAIVPAEELADGWYGLGLMAIDGENSCYVPVTDYMYSFVINAGTIIRYAE